MITTVIFDIGMVLVDFCWRDYLKSLNYASEVSKAVAEAMFLSPQWNEFDRGSLSDEEILESFIQNAPAYEKEIRAVFEHVGGVVKAYDYAVSWVRELKEKGLKVYYLSNYAKKTYGQTKAELAFMDYCDGGLFSFEVCRIKPEPEIYEALFDKYGIRPEEAVFIDDNRANIEGAERLGLHTIHFTGKEQAELALQKKFIEN